MFRLGCVCFDAVLAPVVDAEIGWPSFALVISNAHTHCTIVKIVISNRIGPGKVDSLGE